MPQPVEGHGERTRVRTAFKVVGGTLEGNVAVGAICVAVAQQGGEPEGEVEDVEGDYK